MKQNGWLSKYVLIWTYERGTLQYDIICILILAFIFLIDPACFNKRHYETTRPLIWSSGATRAGDDAENMADQQGGIHESETQELAAR